MTSLEYHREAYKTHETIEIGRIAKRYNKLTGAYCESNWFCEGTLDSITDNGISVYLCDDCARALGFIW